MSLCAWDTRTQTGVGAPLATGLGAGFCHAPKARGSQIRVGVPQASIPLTISWYTPPPARGNRPRTGTWQPSCPRVAGASTPRSWPPPPRHPLLRPQAPSGPRPLARPRSPWPPEFPAAPPAPSVLRRLRVGPGPAVPAAAAGARRVVWLSRQGRLGRVRSLER